MAAKGADQTLVQKFLTGHNPKVFLDHIERVRAKNKKIAAKNKNKARRKAARQARKRQRR